MQSSIRNAWMVLLFSMGGICVIWSIRNLVKDQTSWATFVWFGVGMVLLDKWFALTGWKAAILNWKREFQRKSNP